MPNPLFDMSSDATLVIPETHTAGGTWIDDLATGVAPSGAKLLEVYFRGSHTTWHMHPRGQLLHVVSGAPMMQDRGSEPDLLREGDSHACPPGQWPWHGAAPDAFTIQFSVGAARRVRSGMPTCARMRRDGGPDTGIAFRDRMLRQGGCATATLAAPGTERFTT